MKSKAVYKEGKYHGLFQLWDKDGTLKSEQELVDGVGNGRFFVSGGINGLKEGQLSDGVPVGDWKLGFKHVDQEKFGVKFGEEYELKTNCKPWNNWQKREQLIAKLALLNIEQDRNSTLWPFGKSGSYGVISLSSSESYDQWTKRLQKWLGRPAKVEVLDRGHVHFWQFNATDGPIFLRFRSNHSNRGPYTVDILESR